MIRGMQHYSQWGWRKWEDMSQGMWMTPKKWKKTGKWILSQNLKKVKKKERERNTKHSPADFSHSSVQLLSHVGLFATPCTAARQASLSITNSQSLPKLMSTESVMPSNHLILCRSPFLLPSVFPSIRVFSNESTVCIRWPKYWNFSFSTVLPMNNQGWFPLGLTGLISLLSKGLSRVFSSTTVRKH